MRLTKERKAYVAVFGLGLVALVADRLLFTPAGASAAPVAVDAAPASASAMTNPDPAAEPVRAPSFRERLGERAAWVEGPPRDAFVAPVEWQGVQVAAAGEGPVQEDLEFAKAHRVTAVYKTPLGTVAIVDGQVVKQGKVIDGYTLVGCEDSKDVRAAHFEKDGVRTRIEVPALAEPHKSDKSSR